MKQQQTNNRTKFPGCEKGKAHTAGPSPSVNRPYLAPSTLFHFQLPYPAPINLHHLLPASMAATERCKSIPISTNISIYPASSQPIPFLSLLCSNCAFLFMDLPLGYGFQLPLRPFPSSSSLSPVASPTFPSPAFFGHFPLSNDAAVSVFGFGRHRVTFAVFRLHLLQLPRPFPPMHIVCSSPVGPHG